ncbi:MAG: methyltransferase domain-containing protein [Nitrospinota bacterium]|nr:MAG: methyltransferase domain-containing protein [Nitrospinota bacterium]
MRPNINTREYWNRIWQEEGLHTWRTYRFLFDRIVDLIPSQSRVIDLGCGIGVLLKRLQEEKGCICLGVDISDQAIALLQSQGLSGIASPLPCPPHLLSRLWGYKPHYVVATELLEHLSDEHPFLVQVRYLLTHQEARGALFAVPDNILGPEEEPEHQRKYTEESLARLLTPYFGEVRLEHHHSRLLAICTP